MLNRLHPPTLPSSSPKRSIEDLTIPIQYISAFLQSTEG